MKNSSITTTESVDYVPLSKCDLWEQQKNFFEQQGIEAWNHKVPFYITSNPYIADSYANIIIRFFQDCVNHKKYKPAEPFYILELGAGSGNFGFYLIRHLLMLQKTLNMTTLSFVYVMTDFTEKNIQYWRTHPALQQFIKQGVLDFALYNIEADKTITLLNTGKILARKQLNNPLIVLANYVFDTVSQDVFRVTNKQLQQGLLKPSSGLKSATDQDYVMLNELDEQFTYRNVKLPYYKDTKLDAVIAHYKKNLTEGCFLFPIGSLRCIKTLLTITNQNLLLIATDKGYSSDADCYHQANPGLALHASFSMMVNFHAISQYFKQYNGDCYHQSVQQSAATSAFIVGADFTQLTETKQALVTYLDRSGSHGNLFTLYNHIAKTNAFCTLEVLVSYLSMVHWDPHIFNLCFTTILNKITSARPSISFELLKGMAKIAANFYYLPGTPDILAKIGTVFQEVQHYQTALYYYHLSIDYSGNVDTVLYNIGTCHYLLGEHKNALATFRKLVKIAPDCIMAKGWITQLKMEIKTRTKQQ